MTLMVSFWGGLYSYGTLYAIDQDSMQARIDRVVYQSLAQELSVRSKLIIDHEFGLDRLELRVDMGHLVKALSAGAAFVPFDYAVRMALESFLTDSNDEESPLRIARLGFFKKHKHAGMKERFGFSQDEKVQAFLREKIQQGDAILSLVSGDCSQERPEGGESGDYAWIFQLEVPSLSDHIYWAIVDFDGYRPTYNYGFN
jgi:hypothetical protein